MSVERFVLVRVMAARSVPWLLSACLSVREEARPQQNPCAACHGDGDRGADALRQAAPPSDLMGNTSPAYPGVGAHEVHLAPSALHGGVACSECHEVPAVTISVGHADTALPAELSFGALAASGGVQPSYDALSRRCADTHCHGALSPIWTELAPEPCGGCHGLPPAAPHPQSENCAACHADVIDGERRIIEVTRHVDGHVDLTPIACESCHGNTDSPAPPPSLAGATEASVRGVGAHLAHLEGGAHGRPLACAECHPVPEAQHPFLHPDGTAATIAFSGVAHVGERMPAWEEAAGGCSDTWCHNPSGRVSEPVSWTTSATLACTDCHGVPPQAPHPQVSDCGLCHGAVYPAGGAPFAARERHVDGVIDVEVPDACTGCHASAGVDGAAPSAAPDLGAHAVHLAPRGPARALACSECHVLPSEVFAAGHLDSPAPAEVRFAGVATAFEASPTFAAGRCAETYCHGDSFIGGRPSGGIDTRPSWEAPGTVSALTCQSCHATPPPAPHPQPAALCSDCHRNVDSAQQFIAPETHVDGIVTFSLP